MELNATSTGVMTFDTRTPPKVKQQQKQKKKESVENSHAGVAIPVDVDEVELEATTKKMNFYKIERPTTNSGLSTWILLSGQSSTTKAPKKPIIKPAEDKPNKNLTVVVTDVPPRIVKPIFKKRTTTRKPTTSKNATLSSETVSTTTPMSTTTTDKLTKVKASVLNTAISKKNNTTIIKKHPVYNGTEKTQIQINKTQPVVLNKNTTVSDIKLIDSNDLPMEAKDGETDISNTTEGHKKVNKKKKNKNRRRKPSNEKVANNTNTKVVKHKTTKEKPIGTQLYNYLSREIIPTVGVGMVGLLVTAGLASYFLYPFGAARRSYEVDRRDKEGAYYYNDRYSGGIAEEEAIGKVIAGMPANALYGNSYKSPTSRNSYPGVRYRQVDRRSQVQVAAIEEKIEAVQLTTRKPQMYENSYAIPPNYQSESYQPVTYNLNDNTKYEDNKFVVGSIPKELEEVTPVTVPEHGPRSLKIRRKRSNDINDIENEINSSFEDQRTTEESTTVQETTVSQTTVKHEEIPTTAPPQKPITTEKSPSTEAPQVPSTTEKYPDKVTSFFDLLKDVFHMKVHLGLQLIRNATDTVNTYVTKVQRRFDEHYKNYTESRNKHMHH